RPRAARPAPPPPQLPLPRPLPPGLRPHLAPAAGATVAAAVPAAVPVVDPAVTAAAAKVRSDLDQISQSERNWAAAAIPYSPELGGTYQTGLHKLHAAIYSNIQNIELAISFLSRAQREALVEDLSPVDLQSLAFYEGSLEAYKGICEAEKLLENNRLSLGLVA